MQQSQRHNRNQRRAQAREAAKLQRRYRTNKKRCIHSITGENDAPRCNIPPKELADFFTNTTSINSDNPCPEYLPCRNESIEPGELSSPVEVAEVNTQLRRLPAQSPPGPDSIPHSTWKASTPAAGTNLLHMPHQSQSPECVEDLYHSPDLQEGR